MLIRQLVVVGLVGMAALVGSVAMAQDAGTPRAAPSVGADAVSFADPLNAFSADRFSIDIGIGSAPRFASLAPTDTATPYDDNHRRYEVAVVARDVGGIDVAFAQRGGLGYDDDGELNSSSHGAELRLGRGLGLQQERSAVGEPTWYFFAASEDEALTWRPGSRNAFGGVTPGGFGLQERVEVGDLSAGVTYERNGWQASFAYVEREVSGQIGARHVTRDENFAGVTLTLRN
jgi:hypothetical protein